MHARKKDNREPAGPAQARASSIAAALLHLVKSAGSRPAREHTEVREFARNFAKIARRQPSAPARVRCLPSDADAGEAAAVVVDVLDGTGNGGVVAQEHDKRDG